MCRLLSVSVAALGFATVALAEFRGGTSSAT